MMSEIILSNDDVVFMEEQTRFIDCPTATCEQVLKALSEIINKSVRDDGDWLNQGVPCKVLQQGKKWRTGNIRVRFEFIPDHEAASPLDDLRAKLD